MEQSRVGIIHAYPSRYLIECLAEQGHRIVLIGNAAPELAEHPAVEALLVVPLWSAEALRQAVVEYHNIRPFAALLPVNEGTVVTTAQLCEALGLRGLPPVAALASRNKYLSALLWESQGIAVPKTVAIGDPRLAWPVIEQQLGGRAVLKLVDSMNSQGVIAVTSEAQCCSAVEQLLDMVEQAVDVDAALDRNRFAYGHSSLKLIAQSFCEGAEVSVDVFLLPDGDDQVLAVLEKAPAPGPYFAESASVWPTSLGEAAEQELGCLAIAAARALGLREGPAHVEIRYADGRPCVLEAGLRPGGGYTVQTVEMLTGHNVYAMQARLSLGQPVLREARPEHGAALFGGVVIERSGTLQRVDGLEVFEGLSALKHLVVLCQPSDQVQAMPRSAQPHYCYYLLGGERREELLDIHRQIQANVRLHINCQGEGHV
ncbi:ATP-grasp domain-containing protein [Pseudomonas sp. NCHU5208]|uniref:ATP-grasp domain-containing protein n=1 Tax=unclassified Pseudomonas TaxID=196821 RepID=UPI003F99FCF9